MKRIVLFLLVMGGFIFSGIAQDSAAVDQKGSEMDSKRAQYKTAVMLVPQYALINGLRLDVEFRAGKNAIVIAPSVFAGNGSDDKSWKLYNEMMGAGLDIIFKVNLVNSNKMFVPYGALGIGYDFFSLKVDGTGYYIDNGTWDETLGEEIYDSTYYSYFVGEKSVSLHKPGIDVIFGFQFTPLPRIVFDVSAGIAGKYTIASNEKDLINDVYGRNMFDIGYSGIMPSFHIKIGMKL